jgi:enamine deaminase RidA (YjgF/YER057c/UK114 family)
MNRYYSLLFGIIVSVGWVQLNFAQGKSTTSVRQKAVAKISKQKTKFRARFINPATLPKPQGYTHVVEVTNGRTFYISGQVALDRSGNLIGRGDFRAQSQQVFENIKAALEAVGASFRDVVKLNYYVVDASQVQALREVRDKFVNTESPPASALVEVRRLVRDDFLIEVEATAVLPD